MIKECIETLKGDIEILKREGLKPNYSELGRRYKLDPRTVKKYNGGYQGKKKTRNKGSKLDKYRKEISEKLSINRTSMKGVYEFFIDKYTYGAIGTYVNFRYYARYKLHYEKANNDRHPRYETDYGQMAQCDWKEDIKLTSKHGEVFVFNIFHMLLKASRYSYLELSFNKTQEDVDRCIINSFKYFHGVPKCVLFDNMRTAADISQRRKKVNYHMAQFAKDIGFAVRLCNFRSGFTKGSNEARNKILDWVRPYDGEFETEEDLTTIIKQINDKMNIDRCEGTGISSSLLYLKEKEHLNPLPDNEVLESYLTPQKVLVGNDSLVSFNGNKYSVPQNIIGKKVSLLCNNNKLYIYYNGNLQTIHNISLNPINYHKEHYDSLLRGKVKPDDIEEYSRNNLLLFDNLLEMRKPKFNYTDAFKNIKYFEGFIGSCANKNKLKEFYVSLSEKDKEVFLSNLRSLIELNENNYTDFVKCFNDNNLKGRNISYVVEVIKERMQEERNNVKLY